MAPIFVFTVLLLCYHPSPCISSELTHSSPSISSELTHSSPSISSELTHSSPSISSELAHIPSFSELPKFEKVLDKFYAHILESQSYSNLENSKTAPYPAKLLSLSELSDVLRNYDGGLGLETIVQVYNSLNAKLKYDSAVDLFKNIDLRRVNLTVFHLYHDLSPGKKLPLLFANQGPPSAVLQKKANHPVLNHNSLCGSTTLSQHEGCFSSMEEMLKFVTRRMGENLKVVSPPSGKWQQYMVTASPKITSLQVTGCHKARYPGFGVYKCHNFPNTIAREVTLTGEDGLKLNATSICHMETSLWNKNYLAFQILGTKPGIPVCHFLATDDIVWLTASSPPA